MTARRVGIAALILLSLTPFLIIIATRGGGTTIVTTGAGATLGQVSVEPTTAGVTALPDDADSSTASADPGSLATDTDDNSTATDDDVGSVVEPLSSTTSLQTPRITTAGTPGSTASGPQPTLGPDSSTTTVDTVDPATVGICVFSNGAVASGIRKSACQGTFTTDPDEARRLSNERRGITTTTSTTTTTTTPDSTTTTTTDAPTTTTTTATSTSSTSSTSTTSTTQADTTTTAVDVTPDD